MNQPTPDEIRDADLGTLYVPTAEEFAELGIETMRNALVRAYKMGQEAGLPDVSLRTDKHTEGDWLMENGHLCLGGQVLGIPPAPDGASKEEREANGRLISAVPEMLHAVRLMFGALNEEGVTTKQIGEAIEAAHWALNKGLKSPPF